MTAINTVTQNYFLRSSIKDITAELGRLQEQMTTGLKAKTFADHGAANARRVISLRNDVNRIQSYVRSIDEIDLRAGRVEVALERINALGEQVRETGLKLGNRLVDPHEIARIAEGAFVESYANLIGEVAGHHIFSGTEANRQPLLPIEQIRAGIDAAIAGAAPPDDPDAILAAVTTFFADEANWYQGGGPAAAVEIARNHPVGTAVLANDPGLRDLLTAFGTLAVADPDAIGAEAYAELVDRVGATLHRGLAATRDATGRNGLLRLDLETAKESHAQVQLYLEEQLIDLEQVDLFDAVTKLQALQTQLEATYQVTAQLRRLTLTAYL